MLRQTGSKTCIFVLAFAALVVAKPPPTPSPWASYGKPAPPVSLGSLGPFVAPGMSSISVPYMPKKSPFFPKFVDPKAMISTKTDMLGNLFGGLGPVDYSVSPPGPFSQYPPGFVRPSPVLYATSVDDETQGIKDFTGADDVVGKDKMKRGAFGPGGPKYGSPKASPFSPFAPSFSPFAPQFGPPASGFPFAGIPPKFGPGFFNSDVASSRRRRSIVETEGESTKALGPPPAYPGLAPIAEEPESAEAKLLKLYDPASTPKETLPGMFGPFGPFSPYAVPPIDPMMMASKKTAFLDSLFKSLATTPAADVPVTEIPVPKTTIVPADFWLPSAIIPGPGEYTDKVSSFLDKLFAHIVNKTVVADDGTGKTVLARSLLTEDPAQAKILYSRSVEDIKTIAAAKDAIVDSILAELGDLKTDMISTLNDYILYVKTAPLLPGAKKPSPFAKKPSPFAAFFAPPTADPTLPFKQRMAALSQVFDMLTGLEKNITLAVQDAIKSSTDAPIVQDTVAENAPIKINDASYGPASNYPAGSLNAYDYPAVNPVSAYNATLFDAIKSRLASLDQVAGTGFNKPIGTVFQGKKIARNLAKTPISFWVAYPQADAAPAKRDVEDEDYEVPEYYENQHGNNRDQYKRAVQMQMHQGYQSMPPGTIESVQAGGGSVPGHQGGGIKLLNSQSNVDDWSKWSEWAEYFKNQNQERGHHHNHH